MKQSCHRIEILTGAEPGALLTELSVAAPLLQTPPEVPVGLPSDLLGRRPDVHKAERQLDAAFTRSAAACAEHFLEFPLTGSVGSHESTHAPSTLLDNSRRRAAGFSLTVEL